MDEASCLLQLLVCEDGVECHVDFRVVLVGEPSEAFDLLYAVAGRRPCAKLRRTDVDRVRTVFHGLDAMVRRSCRSEQFDLAHYRIRLML